jgi:hypothetical protein
LIRALDLPAAVTPTFILQYGPLLAAGIALTGVMLTLFITTVRGRAEVLLAREDAYRGEARAALAKLLTTAKEFQRNGLVMSKPSKWAVLGYERATTVADRTEAAMKEMQQQLVIAALLLTDNALQRDLDTLSGCTDRVAEVIHESVDSFWEARVPSELVGEADARWEEYATACAGLQCSGLRLLRPTVRVPRSRADRRAP